MDKTVLITGGAGFIGSHVADELLRAGYRVRVLDSLIPQVHGDSGERPEYLSPDVELQVGDVRNSDAVAAALDGVDLVLHLAARVGVGQSMYELTGYVSGNDVGTTVLLEEILKRRDAVRRLVVASSMSIYGEGLYVTPDGERVESADRDLDQLRNGDWEVRGPRREVLRPIPTPESKTPNLASVYALSKYDQERLVLIFGRAYGMPATALRFFNVYGPRQALSNPYTGVLAIFASRLLNGNRPLIYEDGRQRRDFVSVYDVARACRLALESDAAADQVLNVGSGRSVDVLEIAARLAALVGRPELEPEVTGKYRAGDIRHCFADIALARQVLGYEPQVTLEDGLRELAGWLEGQVAVDRVAEASAELRARGLTL